MKRDFSKFQDDMLIQIVEDHISSVEDFSKISCVCHSWRRASYACDISILRNNWARHQMPWLMLTDGNDDDNVDPFYLQQQMRLFVFPDDYIPRRISARREGRCKMNTDTNTTQKVRLSNGEGSSHMNHGNFANPDHSNINSLCCHRSLLNLSRNKSKCYNLNLHEINERVCWGSQYGWVVNLGLDREMGLYNPLTNARLPLPPQTTFPNAWSWSKAEDITIRNLWISKAVLLKVPRKYGHCNTMNEACLCDNGNSIWLVVAIYSLERFVAIAKPGDEAWIDVELERPYFDEDEDEEVCWFYDVLFWPNMSSLLFTETQSYLYYCDIHDIERPQMLKRYLRGPPHALKLHISHILYLVECMDSILIIIKVSETIHKGSGRDYYGEYRTLRFIVYKLNMLTKNWNEVQDLQDFALFVGPNSSMAICAKDAGCRRNCIYFCDDLRKEYFMTRDKVGGHDMGIYNMSSGIIEPLYTGLNSRSSYCCPFWFSPSI